MESYLEYLDFVFSSDIPLCNLEKWQIKALEFFSQNTLWFEVKSTNSANNTRKL